MRLLTEIYRDLRNSYRVCLRTQHSLQEVLGVEMSHPSFQEKLDMFDEQIDTFRKFITEYKDEGGHRNIPFYESELRQFIKTSRYMRRS